MPSVLAMRRAFQQLELACDRDRYEPRTSEGDRAEAMCRLLLDLHASDQAVERAIEHRRKQAEAMR